MFCFVRNPLTWYESWFKYMRMPERNWFNWGNSKDLYNWHPNSVLNNLGGESFSDFVSNVNSKRPGYVSELFGWYTQSKIDFIGKQESLADDLIKVLKAMKIEFDENFIKDFRKVNVSTRTELTWPQEILNKTVLLEYSSFIRYGYHEILDRIGFNEKMIIRKTKKPHSNK